MYDCISDPAMPPSIILITGDFCDLDSEHSPTELPLKRFRIVFDKRQKCCPQRVLIIHDLLLTFETFTAGNQGAG